MTSTYLAVIDASPGWCFVSYPSFLDPPLSLRSCASRRLGPAICSSYSYHLYLYPSPANDFFRAASRPCLLIENDDAGHPAHDTDPARLASLFHLASLDHLASPAHLASLVYCRLHLSSEACVQYL